MKTLSLLACFVLLLTSAAFSQSSSQDLPSAPSATLPQYQPKPAAPPAQQPAAKDSAPAQQQAPAAAAPQQQTNTAPQTQTTPAFPSYDAAQQETKGKQEPQKQDQDQEKPEYSFKVTANEVNVLFTVTDKHNRFVKDLKKDDFRILDDNKPPAEIRSFASETDLPLRVGLLIDASNSIRDRFKFEQEAAIEFLNQIIRPKSDQAFVLGFDSVSEVTQDFTDNAELLSRGVRSLKAGGGTALFDAIYYACRDKLANANSKQGATRRAIILLSDGDDNQSRVTREEAVEMAQRAEVIIYAISTNITGIKQKGDKVLERFAEATGGRLFTPFKLQDVSDSFTEIQDELRSQYAVAYKPADFAADGRFRTINIDATKNKNLKVRARKGYYAPKATQSTSQLTP